jgi:hypothetical protein
MSLTSNRRFMITNYPSLLALKKQLDPWDSFYSPTGVGSQYWYITGQILYIPTQNGRLCRKS